MKNRAGKWKGSNQMEWKSVLIGFILSLLLSLGLISLLAKLILNGMIPVRLCGLMGCIIAALASLVGTITAVARAKNKKLLCGMITCLLYLSGLLMTRMLLPGRGEALSAAPLYCAAGALLPALLIGGFSGRKYI